MAERAAPSREQSAAALAAANDLIAVLNATLDQQTADAGRLMVDSAPFDPVRMVRELAAQGRPHAAAKGLELNVFVDTELDGRTTGQAMADAARVRQVLANLISNAVKYTVRGRVEVRVERQREPQGGERLAIAVADTGPGLSQEELAEAFLPFKRIERTAAGLPGAGAGLSLSKQLVDADGRRTRRGQRRRGGQLPALTYWKWDAGALVDLEAGRRGRRGASDRHAPLKVLMAEDDGLNAAMLRTILEQLGHQVVHAQNGRRAVDLARAVGFDLIMLDGKMPLMDAPDAIRAIRALAEPVGQVPIIGVIGGEAVEAGDCLAASADAVMRKPVSVAAVAPPPSAKPTRREGGSSCLGGRFQRQALPRRRARSAHCRFERCRGLVGAPPAPPSVLELGVRTNLGPALLDVAAAAFSLPSSAAMVRQSSGEDARAGEA